jgi:hypothetical protein
LLNRLRLLPLQIADLCEPGAKSIVEQVGVAMRGLNLRVAEELADYRQGHARPRPVGREDLAKVMDAEAGRSTFAPSPSPHRLMPLSGLPSALLANTRSQYSGTRNWKKLFPFNYIARLQAENIDHSVDALRLIDDTRKLASRLP